eukprot:NODE_3532_length_773_cov_288.380223.p1 GENE.NODE_3532_length_773_cov_288.380223~~NODE_3532_length_773_cov_288.380223.p1  ORF type:complete len:195 (+),score=34.80 NODE_3532_length_773_cov_288.380223:3-587(+)
MGPPPLASNASSSRSTRDPDASAPEDLDCGDEAANWFNEALGATNLRLHRVVRKPSRNGNVLVTSDASLEELERRSRLDQMARQLQPNIILTGCAAHAEDEWSVIEFRQGDAAAELAPLQPVARGKGATDPMRTLSSYRSGRKLCELPTRHRAHYACHKGDVFFGQCGRSRVLSGHPRLRVKDTVKVYFDDYHQ